MKEISDKARILHLGGGVKEISPERAWSRGQENLQMRNAEFGMRNGESGLPRSKVEFDIIEHKYDR